MEIIVGCGKLPKKLAMKTKTFTLKLNFRAWDLAKYTFSEQLTQKANLTLGKNKWYATHF